MFPVCLGLLRLGSGQCSRQHDVTTQDTALCPVTNHNSKAMRVLLEVLEGEMREYKLQSMAPFALLRLMLQIPLIVMLAPSYF